MTEKVLDPPASAVVDPPATVEARTGVDAPPRRNLVYTSAGDHANLHQWVAGSPEFDLWVTYYGDRACPDLPRARYFERRKGAKFQNLYHAWREQRRCMESYERVFVLDDDIRITTDQINRMFHYLDETGARVIQPAFDPRGKISFPVTRVRGGMRYRRVDFVEVAVSLFRANDLWSFLRVYDPRLPSCGVDWWYAVHLELARGGRAAIIDEIPCLNPHDAAKGNQREIDRWFTAAERLSRWHEIREDRGIDPAGLGSLEYGRQPLHGAARLRSQARVALWTFSAAVARVKRRVARLGR